METGEKIIGRKISQWQKGKHGLFKCYCEIIQYDHKGHRNELGQLIGDYLIDYGNGKQYWRFKYQFELINK